MLCRSRKAAGGPLQTAAHPAALSGPPLAAALAQHMGQRAWALPKPLFCGLSAPLLKPRQAAPSM